MCKGAARVQCLKRKKRRLSRHPRKVKKTDKKMGWDKRRYVENRLDQTGLLQQEECGSFPYHYCHLSRGRSCQKARRCVCLFALCVSIPVCFLCLRTVSRRFAEGRKTITTLLLATTAAYMGGKWAAKRATTLKRPAPVLILVALAQYWPS